MCHINTLTTVGQVGVRRSQAMATPTRMKQPQKVSSLACVSIFSTAIRIPYSGVTLPV